jgi:GNAT superfamily N-acetyltransferase
LRNVWFGHFFDAERMTSPGSKAGDVEEIDARTASDDVLGRFYAVELACHHEVHPGEPVRSRDEAIAYHRYQPATHTSCHWLADGGVASLYVHGPRAAFLHLLVEPRRRRQGIGSLLLGQALRRARELGVEALRSSHTTDAGAAFATRVGAVAEARVVQSVLDLRAVELTQPRAPANFRLLTWLGRVPDEYLAGFVEARAAMDDAPQPEGMDIPGWTAQTVRASEESLARRHREMRLTVAIEKEGSIGAFTELRVSRGSTLGFTDDTGTVEAHRWKGLARAVKIESLRRLRADHPEVETVSTSNAEENAVMRHLNESIGFRPTVVVTSVVLVLAEL